MTRTPTREAIEIGARICARRHVVGLTGEDIHALTWIHPASLSQMEHGHREPTLRQLRSLARVLGVSLDALGSVSAASIDAGADADAVAAAT